MLLTRLRRIIDLIELLLTFLVIFTKQLVLCYRKCRQNRQLEFDERDPSASNTTSTWCVLVIWDEINIKFLKIKYFIQNFDYRIPLELTVLKCPSSFIFLFVSKFNRCIHTFDSPLWNVSVWLDCTLMVVVRVS